MTPCRTNPLVVLANDVFAKFVETAHAPIAQSIVDESVAKAYGELRDGASCYAEDVQEKRFTSAWGELFGDEFTVIKPVTGRGSGVSLDVVEKAVRAFQGSHDWTTLAAALQTTLVDLQSHIATIDGVTLDNLRKYVYKPGYRVIFHKATGVVVGFIEYQQRVGATGVDLATQGAADYARYVAAYNTNNEYKQKQAPMCIVTLVGHHLTVWGIVTHSVTVYDRLADVSVGDRQTGANRASALRLLSALRDLVHGVVNLEINPPHDRKQAWWVGLPRLLEDRWVYREHITRGVYGATDNEQMMAENWIIKFAQRNDTKTQNALAEVDYAPAVEEDIPVCGGAWRVLRMQDFRAFGYISLDVLLRKVYLRCDSAVFDASATGFISPQGLLDKVDVEMQLILRKLHAQHVTFYDIRTPNILVKLCEDMTVRVALCDFEWCDDGGRNVALRSSAWFWGDNDAVQWEHTHKCLLRDDGNCVVVPGQKHAKVQGCPFQLGCFVAPPKV